MNLVESIRNSIGSQLSNLGDINKIDNQNNFDNLAKMQEKASEQLGDDYKSWNEVFLMQDELNKKIAENWKTKNFDWLRAVRMETNELIDSFAWKWWKKGTNNFLNAEIELVDIFHFLISYAINSTKNIYEQTQITNSLYAIVLTQYNSFKENNTNINSLDNSNYKEFLNEVDDFIKISYLQPVPIILFMKFINLWFRTGLNINDLIKLYKAKNMLNGFRQLNGYQHGAYIKIWGIDEDNIIVFKLAKEIELNDNFVEILNNKMEKTYNSLKINK